MNENDKMRNFESPNFNKMVKYPKDQASIKSKVDVSGLNLPLSVKDDIEDVIVFEGPCARRAIDSANNLGLNVIVLPSFFYADKFAGISVRDYNADVFSKIIAPKNYTEDSWPYHVKLLSQNLTYYDVCRILNHMSAWDYSIRTNKPIIILEHDAVLFQKHDFIYPRFNAINMLGDNFLHYHNNNWICGKGVYAYALDCIAAKALFNKIMYEGLINPLELLFRIDEFNVSLFKKACRFHALNKKEDILN